MSEPKYVTEGYVKHGVTVEPLTESERHEWVWPFPDRRKSTWERVSDDQRQRRTRCCRMRHEGRAYYGCSEDAVAVVVKRDRREPMCAAHVRGAIRSAANTARQLAEHQERRARDQQTKERLADLGRRLGGVSLAQEFLWSSGVHSTTTCVVGIDDLERLADRIGRGEATH